MQFNKSVSSTTFVLSCFLAPQNYILPNRLTTGHTTLITGFRQPIVLPAIKKTPSIIHRSRQYHRLNHRFALQKFQHLPCKKFNSIAATVMGDIVRNQSNSQDKNPLLDRNRNRHDKGNTPDSDHEDQKETKRQRVSQVQITNKNENETPTQNIAPVTIDSIDKAMTSPHKTAVIHATDTPVSQVPDLNTLSGLLLVDKPQGWTSFDVVAKVRTTIEKYFKLLGQAPRKKKKPWIKVGHGGTLDPMATGLLVIAVGDATKLMQAFLKGEKEYTTTTLFGAETDTQDAEGKVTLTKEYNHITQELLLEKMKELTGNIMQVPPSYSALKKDGKKGYESARDKGEMIQFDPRLVVIYKFQLDEISLPNAKMTVRCGGGTYIRTLIQDLGRKLDSAAHITSLRRTVQGKFTLANAVSVNQISDIHGILKALESCNGIESS